VAFFTLQATKQKLGIARQMLDAWSGASDAAAALLTAGNISEFEAATHSAAFERAKILVAELELKEVQNRTALQRLFNLPQSNNNWDITPQLAPVSEEALASISTDALIEKNLALCAFKSRLGGTAKLQSVATIEGWLPEVSLDVHSLYGNPTDSADNEPWRFGAGIRFALPVFDRQQGTTAALRAQYDALKQRYLALVNDLETHVIENTARVASTQQRAVQYQKAILPAQARVVEQALLQYNAMQINLFALLQAKRDDLESRLAYVDVLSDYWKAKAEIETLQAGHQINSHTSTEPAE
jgi:outer membrane protein TolC